MKKKPSEYIHVKVGVELFAELEKLRGARPWKLWLESIRDDFRRSREHEKFLEEKVEFLQKRVDFLEGQGKSLR